MSYSIKKFFLSLCCLTICRAFLYTKADLRIIRQWKELEFNFPSVAAEKRASEMQYYIRGNSVPLDVDVHYKDGHKARIFITIPRLDKGRPMTLGIVDEHGRITAYPDYSWHEYQESNCSSLVSVYRTAVDECNRLWVLDSGKIGDTQQVCPPKILAFDLSTDRLVFQHQFNESTFGVSSLFVTPVVDVRDKHNCSGTFIYIADVDAFSLVVLDVDRNLSWRIKHRLFYPYPSRGNFSIDGENFDLMDGVIGMALSPMRPGQDRKLYFHALASTTENVVRTQVLQNDSFIYNSNADRDAIYVFPAERSSQSAAEAMDKDGILYFGLMNPPSIWCWNFATEYAQHNFHKIASNNETLQFASGVKVINNFNKEQELWVLTSSLQRVMTGSLNLRRVNFRIHVEKIANLLKTSPCAIKH